jgi:electron transfer flavoprotein beta subunit
VALEVVVCVKLTHDETQIPIEGEKLLVEKAPIKVSDIDKNAIEEAVRIKEKLGGSVTVISVVTGPYDEAVLNEALAMGADRAFIVEGISGTNPVRTAKAIAEVIRKMGIKYDLILCGEGSSDQYSCAIAPMLAEYLSIPVITFVGKLEIEGNVIRGERLLEKGYELVETELPAVVSVTSEINEPRIPSVLQVMRAGKREKVLVKSSDLDLKTPNVDLVDVKAYLRERLRKKIEGDLESALREVISVLREKGVIS